ncbi:MAG: sulfatase [Planctomycetes bacterium]|nr:sulfatase [Planctomycetota bacterium]
MARLFLVRLLPLPLFAACVTAQAGLSGSRPNILFIFSDDHAAHAISAYGSRVNQTPNIDRIAANGALFRNNFCGNSLCGPSRATILTGKHSHANGFMRNGNTFDPAQPTMAKLLQATGYQTAMIGKWHLTSDPQGFDHWIVLPGQGQYYNPDFLTPDGRKRIEGHATNITTDLALDWLEQRDPDKPFLLMCQHKAPHRNWMPAPEDLALYADRDIPEPPTLFDDYAGRTEAAKHQEMTIARHMYLHYDLVVPPTAAEREAGLVGPDRSYDDMMARLLPAQREAWDAAFAPRNAAFRADEPTGRERVRWAYQRYIKNYLRCVNGVDRSVGRLLDWLDAHPDVKANTLVVYSSDQGFYLGDHGWYDKRWMYEESLKMPLVVSWPGHVAAGVEIPQLTQNIDFAPTFLDLAGVDVPADMHGASLVPLLSGGEPDDWRDAIYYHYYESNAVHMVPEHYGVRTARYKLVRYYEPQWDAWELFDLARDPDELHSVHGDPSYADILAGLKRRLVELRRQYGDDTGTLGEFDVTAGIARVQLGADGYRVWANATGGYLLRSGDPGGTKFTTAMTSVGGRQLRNGFVLLSGDAESRGQLVRAGIEFGARQLTVIGPGGMRQRASAAIEWDGRAPLELVVTVDLAAHSLTAAAAGQRVTVELPAEWTELTACGYGASNAETVFTPLSIE